LAANSADKELPGVKVRNVLLKTFDFSQRVGRNHLEFTMLTLWGAWIFSKLLSVL
jgi:hypothetical protein